jgi:hypothetical protein
MVKKIRISPYIVQLSTQRRSAADARRHHRRRGVRGGSPAHYLAIILPSLVSPFGVFLMRV